MSSMKQFKMMFQSHIRITFREKQAWFWGIFFPVILMVLFMTIFSGGSNEDFKAKIAVVETNPNVMSQMLLKQIQQLPVLEIESGEPVSREQAEAWVKAKDVSAAILLPESDASGSLQIIVNKENEQGAAVQAVASMMDRFVQQANMLQAGVAPNYDLRIHSISEGSNELKYTDFLLTGMIALSIAQGGLFGMVDMVEMRRKGLLKRLRMTPARMGLFGLSDMSVRVLFSIVQIILLSLIGVFGFGASLHIDFLSLIVVFFAGVLTFTAMGYFISSFCKTMEAYMGISNIASFFMMFITGIFFPIEAMPSWLQPVSMVLPLTYFVEGLRDAMVYSSGIFSSSFWSGIGILAIWGAASFGLGSWLYQSKSIAAAR